MYIARIVGKIWASTKNENLEGRRLYIVQPLDRHLEDSGEKAVAVDNIGVGEGEIVWVEGGREAAFSLPKKYGPSDASIIGKVDHLDMEEFDYDEEARRLMGGRK